MSDKETYFCSARACSFWIWAFPASAGSVRFKIMDKTWKLRAKLAALYPSAAGARQVASDAKIRLERIDWSGSAEDVWFSVLEEAERSNLINEVTRIASQDYPAILRVDDLLEPLLTQRDALLANDASANIDELNEAIARARRKMREGPLLQVSEYLGNNRYQLLKEIGHGDFGTVWKAYDRRSRRHVAIKVLHGQWARDASRIERFNNGALALAQLRHLNIVQIEQLLESESGFHYFVMEYVEGGTLYDTVLENRIKTEDALQAVWAIGDALVYAHEKRVIHRDVKPENILFRKDGTVLLTDFDLARLDDSKGATRTRAMLGSHPYASPEAIEAPQQTNEQSDLYSLGMTAIFVMHGAEFPAALILNRKDLIETVLLNSKVVDEVKDVIRRAVAMDPRDRQSSVAVFLEDLEKARISAAERATREDALRHEQKERERAGKRAEAERRVTLEKREREYAEAMLTRQRELIRRPEGQVHNVNCWICQCKDVPFKPTSWDQRMLVERFDLTAALWPWWYVTLIEHGRYEQTAVATWSFALEGRGRNSEYGGWDPKSPMLIHHWDNPQTVHYLDGKVQKGERTIEGSGSVLGSTMEAIDTEAIATDDFSLELVQGKRKVGVQIVAPELRVGTFAVFGDRKGNLGAHSNMPTAHIINWFEDHTY